jgi:elongator complex protein 1
LQFDVFDVDGEQTIIGRTLMGLLYVNNVDVMKSCSSYFIHSNFILVTTTDHKLLCIPRTKDGVGIYLSSF